MKELAAEGQKDQRGFLTIAPRIFLLKIIRLKTIESSVHVYRKNWTTFVGVYYHFKTLFQVTVAN